MKLHRFYIADTKLVEDLVIDDKAYTHQWTKVLRFRVGRGIALFNNDGVEYLYVITMIDKFGVRLRRNTEIKVPKPHKEVHLCFSLLKKDKNDWVLQKATELGVSHFVPLLCDRTEKTGFDENRARKIVVEAAEQCGRVDIPTVLEPITPQKLLEKLSPGVELFVAEQGSPQLNLSLNSLPQESVAILIGPEGGWSDQEKQLFNEKEVKHISLSNFTLRAETAAVTAAALLQ